MRVETLSFRKDTDYGDDGIERRLCSFCAGGVLAKNGDIRLYINGGGGVGANSYYKPIGNDVSAKSRRWVTDER